MSLYVKIWCLSMLLCAVLSLVIYCMAELRHSIIKKTYFLMLVTQVTAVLLSFLGVYNNTGWLKGIFIFCLMISPLAILGLYCILKVLKAQYHVKIKDAVYVEETDYKKIVPSDGTKVYETKDLYIFFPEYRTINFVFEKLPKKSDQSITWLSGAAFQHELLLNFSTGNIEGSFASGGRYYEGAPLDSAKKYGAFVFYDGHFAFCYDDPEAAVKKAADHGGDGFMQWIVISDGKPEALRLTIIRDKCFRVLAELNGNLCIIDVKKRINIRNLVGVLEKLGLSNALYLDMGAGWNYSWYRRTNGSIKMLFKLRLPWGKNWLVFRK